MLPIIRMNALKEHVMRNIGIQRQSENFFQLIRPIARIRQLCGVPYEQTDSARFNCDPQTLFANQSKV